MCLAFFFQHDILRFIHVSSFILFYCWAVFHRTNIPQLVDPSSCWGTPELFLGFGCLNKVTMNIHLWVSMWHKFSFSELIAQQCNYGVMWQTHVQLHKKLPYSFPKWLQHFTFPSAMYEWSIVCMNMPASSIITIFCSSHSDVVYTISSFWS